MIYSQSFEKQETKTGTAEAASAAFLKLNEKLYTTDKKTNTVSLSVSLNSLSVYSATNPTKFRNHATRTGCNADQIICNVFKQMFNEIYSQDSLF